MKAKWTYSVMAILNIVAITAAVAASQRRHSETVELRGKEAEAAQLCSQVIEKAKALPQCVEKDETGDPLDVQAGETCINEFYVEHPGDEETLVRSRSSASWSCDTH